jgi:hypothetical protein
MQQQFKDDLKAAWQATVPTLKSIAIFVVGATTAITWVLMVLWQLCTNFWVGMLMIGISIVVGMLAINYLRVVGARKDAAENEAYWAERRKARGY